MIDTALYSVAIYALAPAGRSKGWAFAPPLETAKARFAASITALGFTQTEQKSARIYVNAFTDRALLLGKLTVLGTASLAVSPCAPSTVTANLRTEWYDPKVVVRIFCK